MANPKFNPQKNTKTRRPESARPSVWSFRRKTIAILAASAVLAVAALFNGVSEKFPGTRSAPAPEGSTAPGATYRMTEAPDGDTVVLRASSGKEIRVRLYGVDAPELHQSGGKAAAKFTYSRLRPERVTLRVMDKDKYGRTVALVFLKDGQIFNEELVRTGHAWVERAHCREEPMCSEWYKHEYLAQKEGRGLWRDEKPLPPWKWREQNPRK